MISIIIPVYNASAFLDQCIDSIASQSYQDWECILVDDGSTDNSGTICDKWTEKDSRIKVIHQQNAGVSAARNKGLNVCSGEYICFVDSDDWLEEGYLSLMINHTNDADLIVSGQIREYPNGKSTHVYPKNTESFSLTPENINIFTELNSKSLLYAPHEKLYLSSIIKSNHLVFPIGCQYGEDLTFNYHYLNYVKKIVCINKALYHYRLLQNSLSTIFRPNQFFEDYNQWIILKQFYIRHSLFTDKAKEYLYKRLWGIIYDGIFIYPRLTEKPTGYLKKVLTIPEIKQLGPYKSLFPCSTWIKWAILNSNSLLFRLYFKLIKK